MSPPWSHVLYEFRYAYGERKRGHERHHAPMRYDPPTRPTYKTLSGWANNLEKLWGGGGCRTEEGLADPLMRTFQCLKARDSDTPAGLGINSRWALLSQTRSSYVYQQRICLLLSTFWARTLSGERAKARHTPPSQKPFCSPKGEKCREHRNVGLDLAIGHRRTRPSSAHVINTRSMPSGSDRA